MAWYYCLHDRAWHEREVLGKTCDKNANGLERKYDVDAYGRRVERLAGVVDVRSRA
jgi:hypothetical protein